MQTMGEDVDGDVMGDIMGEDVDGDDVVGARRGRLVRLPRRPRWRQYDIAPGIHGPREGLEILPMTPNLNNGQFDATNVGALITFTGKPQRPFRGERLVAFIARVADAGVVPPGFIQCNGIFVGTNLQQMQQGEFNVEIFGPTAFGVRQSHTPAAPGIDITMQVRCTVAPTGTQKIQVSLQILGRSLAT
jgi:hypothetical protein